MMLNYYITKHLEQQKAVWSGGTTTELCIYPTESEYNKRNFSVRVSTATVDDEQSQFTSLEGYQRYIMLLEGEMRLQHQNHHNVRLDKYAIDYFSGRWQTHCVGQCRDYNLILAEDWLGYLEAVTGQPRLVSYYPQRLLTLYSLQPECRLTLLQPNMPDQEIILGQFDFLCVPPQAVTADFEVHSSSLEPSLIMASAWQKPES